MAPNVDLHLHTHFSDGTSSPDELLQLVRNAGLSAFSVTDHDTVDGYYALGQMLTPADAELVAGIELSVSVDNRDMHLLAYLFDPQHDRLKEALARFQEQRSERGKKMVDKLNAMGISITFDDVEAMTRGAVVGRPHVARAMHDKKAVKYYEEAFQKYIGSDGPAYVPKTNFAPREAIELIHEAGGLSVLAHPGIEDKAQYLDMLLGLGLDGVEVYHPAHTQSDIDRFKHLAERHRLVITGGSDFHGSESPYSMVGSQKVPRSCLETLKATKK